MPFDIDFNLAQAIGLLASSILISAFLTKNDVKMKYVAAMGNVFFLIHFLMLGATAGAITNVVNASRGLSSIKFHKSNKLMFFFMTVYLICAFVFVEKWLDVLPFATGFIGSYALFQLHGIALRSLVISTSFMWMVYHIYFMSIGGIITECFIISVNCITIYRLLKDRQYNDTPKNS